MPTSRFLRVWLLWSALYTALAVAGPNGLLGRPVWPVASQHLFQARAWLGVDIEVVDEVGVEVDRLPVEPRLDVTPYFENRPVRDPRENALVSNLAVAARLGDGSLVPAQEVWGIRGRTPDAGAMVCFVGFPPGPAFLLMPLVPLLGGFLATQWIGAVLAGLGVAAVDALATGLWDRLGLGEDPVVMNQTMLLAGAGTVWLWVVMDGGTFLFAQTVGCVALAVALLAAARGRVFIAGLAFGLAITSRPAMLGALPFWLGLSGVAGLRNIERLRRLAALFVGPAVLGGTALLLNHLRFGSLWDFGYRFMILPPFLRERWVEHGQLSWHHLWRNVQAVLLNPPVTLHDEAGGLVFPFLVSDPVGMGLLFVTPASVLLVLAVRAVGTRERWILATCWLSLLLCWAPGLLYYNTGWVQWGGRFLLDGWPMWMLLAGLGLSRTPRRLAWLLVGLSVLCNFWAVVLVIARVWPGCCS